MSVSSRLNRSDKAGSKPHQKMAGAAWASGILWALAGFGLAHAQPPTCTPALKNSPASVQINYDPFLAGATPTHLTFQLVNQTDTTCKIDLAVTNLVGEPVLELPWTDIGLVLAIRPTDAQIQSTKRTGIYEVILEAGQSKDISFDLSVSTDAVVPAGHYVQSLFLAFMPSGDKVATTTTPFQLALNALPRAQMNLSGASGSFGTGPTVSIVNFGMAETGKVQGLFIQTRTNAPARLTFNSANHGRMVLDGDPSRSHSLPYSVTFDGAPLDLETIAIRPISPPINYSGTPYPLILQLGDVTARRAGHYSDELTIEITTL